MFCFVSSIGGSSLSTQDALIPQDLDFTFNTVEFSQFACIRWVMSALQILSVLLKAVHASFNSSSCLLPITSLDSFQFVFPLVCPSYLFCFSLALFLCCSLFLSTYFFSLLPPLHLFRVLFSVTLSNSSSVLHPNIAPLSHLFLPSFELPLPSVLLHFVNRLFLMIVRFLSQATMLWKRNTDNKTWGEARYLIASTRLFRQWKSLQLSSCCLCSSNVFVDVVACPRLPLQAVEEKCPPQRQMKTTTKRAVSKSHDKKKKKKKQEVAEKSSQRALVLLLLVFRLLLLLLLLLLMVMVMVMVMKLKQRSAVVAAWDWIQNQWAKVGRVVSL